MATAENTATCPLCDDYSGKPSSVEAHISRMTDPIHKGEVGRAHRDHLQGRVATTDDVESSDDQAEATEETTATESSDVDFPERGDLPSPDTDTTGQESQEGETVPTEEELGRQRRMYADQESSDQEESDDKDDQDDVDVIEETNEPAGVPVPVSTGTLVVGAVGLLALYWFVFARPESSDVEDDEPAQNGQQSGMTTPDDAGLVEEW